MKYFTFCFVVLSLLSACDGVGRSTKLALVDDEGASTEVRGVYQFMYGDFDSLTLDGMRSITQPWRISNVARYLRSTSPEKPARSEPDIHSFTRKKLEKFGFIYPDRIANLPPNARVADWPESPLGLVDGGIENPALRVTAASIGCATCHSGRLYDAHGLATNDVWLGIPNTSLNLESYTADIMKNLEHVTKNRARWRELKATYRKVFPDAQKESESLHLLGSQVRGSIREFSGAHGRLSPYPIGSPGMTNGIGALKTQFGLIKKFDFSPSEVGFVSIPVLADRTFRSSLLVDGIYSPLAEPSLRTIDTTSASQPTHLQSLAKIVALFLIPTMGISPEQAAANVPRVELAMEFVKNVRSPPFPGVIDLVKATKGHLVFKNRCASCHGAYSADLEMPRLVSFPNHFQNLDSIGTDPQRAMLVDAKSVSLLMASAAGRLANAKPQYGYVAPPLSGLWISAPYLHNGSIPTLWHLLTPEERPLRFFVGGHALDYGLMGIRGKPRHDAGGDVYAYPTSYVPFSAPFLYDTRAPGQSNQGHDTEVQGLSEHDKWNLIEFLKLI